MPLIADICPNCQRITRCQVIERSSVTGGILFGVPFIIPTSSISCCCGVCGCEFKSQAWDYERSISPAEAVTLNIDQILRLTNPTLYEDLALRSLKEDPRLEQAFNLIQMFRPSSLRTDLKNALADWPLLDPRQQDLFLMKIGDCAQALSFARLMAGQSKPAAAGCLGGILVCGTVWFGCFAAFGTDIGLWGWLGTLGAGFMAGSFVANTFWSSSNRRWINSVLLPEAERGGICLGWLLQILERCGRSNPDELASLRELAPEIRSEIAALGKVLEEPKFVAASPKAARSPS